MWNETLLVKQCITLQRIILFSCTMYIDFPIFDKQCQCWESGNCQHTKNRNHTSFCLNFPQDVGHLVLEAYSRVLGNLAYSILSRIGDVLQEDAMCNPNSPTPTCCFPGMSLLNNLGNQMSDLHSWQPLIGHSNSPDMTLSSSKGRGNSPTPTPSRNRAWCIGREVCSSVSSGNNSPQPFESTLAVAFCCLCT